MSEIAIRTESLSRDFANVCAVDSLSLEVPRGIVFGFLGANGSGKTTTIRLLLGLLEPTGGKAQVLGFDTRSQGAQIRQNTGALLEHPGLYERLCAEDNLEFYGRVWHIPPAKRQARIKELLGNLGLWERRREPVGKWSRGMKQKLAVARAMLHSPPLIFLDEPTAGFDPVASAALRDDLQQMVAREGVTVFLTTHNLVEAEKLCKLVGVIRKGKLLAVGSPDELRSSGGRVEIVGRGFTTEIMDRLGRQVERVEWTGDRLFLVLPSGTTRVAPIITQLVQAGVEIEEVKKGSASLEEVFLTLMKQEL